MNGQCQNGGCQRLATVQVVIDGAGSKGLCYHCHQALLAIFGRGMRRVEDLPAWRQRSLARDFTGSVA